MPMPQETFSFQNTFATGAIFSSQNWVARLYILEENLCKVLVHKKEAELPQSYSVSWGSSAHNDNPNNRWEPEGFAFPLFTCAEKEHQVILETQQLRVVVSLPKFHIHWYSKKAGEWYPLVQDRPTQSYNFDGLLGRGSYHYLARQRTDMHFGLGERTGNVVKTQGNYHMCNVDCMGYDAEFSDPLYKHVPYYMGRTDGGFYAVYYDTPADCRIDLGREMDNYHGLYQYFHVDAPFLDYYFFTGQEMQDIVPRFAKLGGLPCFPPKWSLGYLASSMAYTDAPNAQQMLLAFLQQCKQEDIPCSGFHLSSGYTLIGDKRYVFNWDRGRFPDPKSLFEEYEQNGIKLIANIKPCLLEDHSLYEECGQKGLFVKNADGEPQISQFWDAMGSYLDLTNPDTQHWWKEKVTAQLLEYGIHATWNDNNEFEIWDTNAHCAGMGNHHAAHQLKPVLTLQMLAASQEAQQNFAPDKRPFLISRAGCLGMQRYVQTWSGDNYTSWKTLRFNHKMGIGMSLSGIYNFGHDVGGFAGPKPEPELFVRWVQHGIFMPRFSIHSWNEDGSVNEAWMYPAYTPIIRELILLRYQLLPFLYNLLYRSHKAYEPIVCPVFYHFPHETNYETDLYLLGRDMLVANVFDEGVNELTISLPAGCNWYDVQDNSFWLGGTQIHCDAAPAAAVPMFMRAGSILPLNIASTGFASKDTQDILCKVFAPQSGSTTKSFFMDDGESYGYQNGFYDEPTFTINTTKTQIDIHIYNAGKANLCKTLAVEVIDALHRTVTLHCSDYRCTLQEPRTNR